MSKVKLFAQKHGNNNYSPYFCAKLHTMETIDEIFAKNKGYLTSKLIRGNRTLYYQLKTLLENEKVVQIKRGLYRHLDFAEEASWGEVCRIATYSGAYPPINSGRIKSARAAIKSVIPADMHPF